MTRSSVLPINIVSLVCLTFLSAGLAAPMYLYGQQNGSGNGVIDDWTQHHVVFSNPGSEADAIRSGRHAKWLRIVSDPRYRAQWLKRYSGQAAASGEAPATPEANLRDSRGRNRKPKKSDDSGGLWTAPLGNGTVALDMYPAKYTFSPIGAPSCTDFVVFPNDAAGAMFSYANIVGVNHLYATTCGTPSGSPATPPPIPSYYFSYFVGTGAVQTSPVLSENGTKVAFVESITGNGTSTGSKFHVVTIGTTGTNFGSSSSAAPVNPCIVYTNGTETTSSCTTTPTNNAEDVNVTMSGDVSVTRSSPFVDYTHDVAYVGDDNGVLHKFTGVFNTTPTGTTPAPGTIMAEVTTSPWPVNVAPAGTILTGPTYDSVSGNIFIGGSNGVLYCINSTTGASCGSVIVGSGATGGGILDAPIVDSTEGTVFTEANNFTASCTSPTATGCALLTQVTTSMTNPVYVNVGYASSSSYTDLYNGAFGNMYLTTHTGNIYFCGNLTGAATPALWQVPITNGVMAGATSGSNVQLVQSGNTGTAYDCSPLTEFYNANGNTTTTPPSPRDFLFIGVKLNASACPYNECIAGFDLSTTFPIPTASSLTISGGGHGTSGMVIDNASTTTGASQIYFGNSNSNAGEQASQAALQ